jgi:hypothetical protein
MFTVYLVLETVLNVLHIFGFSLLCLKAILQGNNLSDEETEVQDICNLP